ncbi:Fpg/Nei family DNA glycosylase [Alicyclobacillus fodiniaquatilis]|uniref:Formamidopyrimidine-DNA glycosylase n=1 Tax=Alicyclobacillus fodiniaquatilis TaxID=1661150 RepID=A0ABW4JHQ8_9BACL
MPELPEMETYRTRLLQTVVHKPIEHVEILREKTINVSPADFIRRVRGRQITDVTRRGKHLVFWLDSGDALLLHLMLGGWLYFGNSRDTPSHRSQVILSLPHDEQLFFLGLRLGFLHLLTGDELAAKLADLGPEPLDAAFTETAFTTALKTKRGPIKFALVNQHCMAGIGNCYADEICFTAGVLPLKPVIGLQPNERARLYQAMHTALTRAISYGGYMEFPFSKTDESTGGYNEHCLVYDRGGEPCLTCGQPITQTAHAKRKVFYCSHCQQ